MGVSQSIPPQFEEFKNWPWDRVLSVIKTYTEEEYDFGIDVSCVEHLTGFSKDDSRAVVTIMTKNETGIINAVAFLCAVISLAESSQRLEKRRLEALFGLVDFNQSSKISLDELTVLFICISSAYASILGKKEAPSEPILTQMTSNIYEKLRKSSSASITKAEFISWASETLEMMGIASIENIYDLFLTGGPKIEEDDVDGIPKLYLTAEQQAAAAAKNAKAAQQAAGSAQETSSSDATSKEESVPLPKVESVAEMPAEKVEPIEDVVVAAAASASSQGEQSADLAVEETTEQAVETNAE